ncbi:MAG: rhodanese-like domain-containing protein, partial [Myxococcota bacterium]
IPTATNVPHSEIETRLGELQEKDGRLLVLYGRTSDEARDLAERMRADGAEVAFLAGGFLHWESDGLEVERG